MVFVPFKTFIIAHDDDDDQNDAGQFESEREVYFDWPFAGCILCRSQLWILFVCVR